MHSINVLNLKVLRSQDAKRVYGIDVNTERGGFLHNVYYWQQ